MNAHSYITQKRMLDLLVLGFQVVVSPLMWVLGSELWPSSSAVCALKHSTISRSYIYILKKLTYNLL